VLHRGAEHHPPDASKTVDPDLCHLVISQKDENAFFRKTLCFSS